MRIEKLNDNKLKIMFNSQELEENNITVHSFLSGSNEAQKLFLAILDIANEEFGFDIKNCNISSETISFGNKDFVIFVTKSLPKSEKSENTSKISPYNLLDLIDYNHTENSNYLGFLPPLRSENEIDKLIYKFKTIEEVFEFCKYANTELPIKSLINSLYKYNDSFFIIIDIKRLVASKKQLVIAILSEYKDYIYLSPLAYTKLIEHSTLILENKAIQAL